MLEVKNLVKNYGNVSVLKGISFKLEQGKIYGFLGLNGAGKTTTMNILTGIINFKSGEILFDGKSFNKNKTKLLKKIGYLPQSPVFYNYMNAYEYLDFIGTLNGMNRKEIEEKSEEVLKIVNLKDSAKRKIGEYSGGMKQRFGIAAALLGSPEILILDEPTSALDPEGRIEILDLILKLKSQNKTIFLSSHILNDIERICDEISILHHGKIILKGSLAKIKNDYIKPIYDITFEGNAQGASESFKELPYVESVEEGKNKISIYVKDMDAAKHELFKFASSKSWIITSFNLRHSTLEDIFIRLVNKNVNI